MRNRRDSERRLRRRGFAARTAAYEPLVFTATKKRADQISVRFYLRVSFLWKRTA